MLELKLYGIPIQKKFRTCFLLKDFKIRCWKSKFGISLNHAFIPFQKKLKFSLNTFILGQTIILLLRTQACRTWISITGIAINPRAKYETVKFYNKNLGLWLTINFFVYLIDIWHKFERMANNKNQDNAYQHTSHRHVPKKKQ